MAPENINERKAMQIKFASLYLASMVLIGIVITALWTGRKNELKPEGGSINHVQLSQQQMLYKDDEILHARFKELQKLEQDYVLLLGDTAVQKGGKYAESKFTALNNSIDDQMQNLSGLIDSVKKTRELFTFADTKEGIEKIIVSFAKDLQYHRMNGNLRNLVSSGNFAPEDIQAIAKRQSELQEKDNRIQLLEETLNKIGSTGTIRPITASQTKSNDEGDKSLVSDYETKNAYLNNVNKSLKEDNDRLLAEMAKFKRLLDNDDLVTKEKQTDLEKKVKDLTDELYLAHVDCNLSRADAKQIVYNSKQRKDLLAEALGVLKNLSQTGNANVQEKVREKTAQLQNIANTVRD